MKYVPNVLSVLRVLMSPLLVIPFIVHRPSFYIPLYFAIGMTDVLDGRIARHYKVESELGSKLDILGDYLFFLCIFASLLVPPRLPFAFGKSLATISVALLLKCTVLLITRARFKVWNGMHTYLDKTVGFLQFFAVPIFFMMNEINYWVLFAVAAGLSISAFEEIYILFTSSEYDQNHPGVFVLKWRERRANAA